MSHSGRSGLSRPQVTPMPAPPLALAAATDRPRLRVAAGIAAVVALLAALHVPAQFSRGPWNPDEPRYIEVAREMKLTGNYVLPHLNGEIYREKPPLYFWSVCAAERLTGDFLSAGRAVTAFGVALIALATGLLGAHLFGARTGVAAAAIVVTCLSVVDYGQRALIDPFFTGLVSLATYALVRSADAACAPAQAGFSALAALLCAAAVLAKGPLGVLLPPFGAVVLGAARRGRDGIPVVASLASVVAGAAAGFLWLGLAAQAAGSEGDRYWWRLAVEQSLRRVHDSYSHKQPFWHYAVNLPWALYPWSLFVPAAAIAAFRERRADRARAGLLYFAAAGFLVFSAISGKRTGYVLPLFPAVAILVARRFAETDSGSAPEARWDTVPRVLAGAAFVLGGIGLAAFPLFAGRLPALAPDAEDLAVAEFVSALPPQTGALCLGLGAALAAIGLAAARARVALGPRGFVALGAAGAAVAFLAAHAVFYRAIDPQKSARLIGEHVARELPPGERLVLYPSEFNAVINYYTGALHYDELKTPEQLEAALANPGRLWVVTRAQDLRKLRAETRERLEVRGAYRVGRKIFYFLAERGT